MEVSGYQAKYQGSAGSNLAVAKLAPPDWLIKYEPVNEPCPPGGLEEAVAGGETEVVTRVQDLIESGRTTPGRVRVYANTGVNVFASVQFAPKPAATR